MQQARVMQGARSTATRGIRKVAGTPSRLSAAGKRLASNLRAKTSAADKQLRASYTAGTPCMCSAPACCANDSIWCCTALLRSEQPLTLMWRLVACLTMLTCTYYVSLLLQLGNAQTLESGAHRLRLCPGGEAVPAPQLCTLAAWPRLSHLLQQCRHQYFLLLMPTSQTICCRYKPQLFPTPSPPLPSFLPTSNCTWHF